MMVKLFVGSDESYPVFYANTTPDYFETEIEVTEAELKRIGNAWSEYNWMQSLLRERSGYDA